MDTFRYKAKDSGAATLEGTLQAESRQAALEDLEARGLFPLELVVADEAGHAGTKAARWFGRVGGREITGIIRQLADLLRAGINLDAALDILMREAERDQVKELLGELRGAVAGGVTFSEALRARGDLFEDLVCNMVAAGEEGGFLDGALDRVASFREKRDALVGKIREAMVYPAILTLLGSGTVIYLLTFFIPRFSEMFSEMGAALPAPTRILLAVSGVLQNWWWLAALVIGGVGFAAVEFTKTETGQRWRDTLLLRLPLVGPIARQTAMARLSRTLGTLLGAGVPVLRGLQISGRATGNSIFIAAVDRIADRVSEGSKLGEAMEREALFPPSFRGRVAVGEESGKLEEILVRMADGYEEGVDRAVKIFVTAFEPLMICVLAGVVGFIVIAMLLPIFNLSKALQQ